MLYVWGRNHPDTADMLCGVGNAWEKLGRLDRAIAYHEEAIEVLKETSADNYKTIKEKDIRIEELRLISDLQNHLPLRLYIDMDDVLCDYMKAHEKESSANPNNPYPQSREGFYLDLEPIKDAIEAMEWIARNKNIDAFILSAPSVYNPHSYTGKRLWIEKHLGFDWCNRLVLSPDKSIVQKGILIDDLIEGHGKENFDGKIIHFKRHPLGDWKKIRIYLSNLIENAPPYDVMAC